MRRPVLCSLRDALAPMTRTLVTLTFVLPALGACGLAAGGPEGPALDGGPDAALDAAATGKTPTGAACTCGAAAPMGWTYVVLDQDDATAACPAEYGNPRPHVDGLINKPANCPSCMACVPGTPGACTLGALAFRGGQSNACNDKTSTTNSNTNGCYDIQNWDSPNSGTTFAGATESATGAASTCTAATITPDLPSAYQHKGETCALTGPLGTTCGAGRDCVPDAPAPFKACVLSQTPAECPAEFPAKHEVGNSVNDQRGCAACTCDGQTDCSQGSMALYSDDNCGSTLSLSVPIGPNTCTSTNTNNLKIHSVKVTVTPTATCTGGGGAPTGTVAFDTPHTVCCRN